MNIFHLKIIPILPIIMLVSNSTFAVNQPDWCRNKLNAAQQVICNNPEIWDLEEQNRQLYFYLYQTEQAKKENKTNAIAWLRYRNKQCLISVSTCVQEYRNRINFLSDLARNKQNNPTSPQYSQEQYDGLLANDKSLHQDLKKITEKLDSELSRMRRDIKEVKKKTDKIDVEENNGMTLIKPKE